jgi:hypothetical protein
MYVPSVLINNTSIPDQTICYAMFAPAMLITAKTTLSFVRFSHSAQWEAPEDSGEG